MANGWTGLRALQAPAIEPVTTAQAKAHARVDADYDDTLIDLYVSSAREKAETYLNRALLLQRWTFNITWSPPPTATPLVPQSLIVFPLNWPPLVKRPVELPRAPALSVEQIRWGPLGELTVADPEDYTINVGVDPGYVAVKPQLLPQIPQQTMEIDFTAGMAQDDTTLTLIPANIRHAILVGTAFFYENRGDTDADMPAAFYHLLDPYRLWTFAG